MNEFEEWEKFVAEHWCQDLLETPGALVSVIETKIARAVFAERRRVVDLLQSRIDDYVLDGEPSNDRVCCYDGVIEDLERPMMSDFFEAQLREAYALRDGVVLDPAKFPEVTQDEAGFFRVGSWAF
jgi:hypothetical protein